MAFISSNYKPVFTSEAMPRLVTLYRAETPYTSMPRTMHRHGDVAEFILITGGAAASTSSTANATTHRRATCC